MLEPLFFGYGNGYGSYSDYYGGINTGYNQQPYRADADSARSNTAGAKIGVLEDSDRIEDNSEVTDRIELNIPRSPSYRSTVLARIPKFRSSVRLYKTAV